MTAVLGFSIIMICAIISFIIGLVLAISSCAYNFWFYFGIVVATISFLGILSLGFSLMFGWIT